MAADLLTIIRAEIDFRLRELEPAVHEYEELMALREALAAPGMAPVRSRREGGPRAGAAPAGDRSERARSKAAQLAPTRGTRARRPAQAAPSAEAPALRRPARPRAKRTRMARTDAGGQAILAALDHGSHTIAELGVVTALPASELRISLRALLVHSLITKTDRAGKTAYALAGHG